MRKQRVVWDEPLICEAAKAFTSRTEFAKSFKGAYRAALKHDGLLERLFGPSRMFVWTEPLITAEAMKYATRAEFMSSAAGCYGVAVTKFPTLLDSLFVSPLTYWTKESAIAEASKYGSRVEFRKNANGALKFLKAKHPGAIEEVFGESKRQPLTLRRCVAHLTLSSSRKDMQRRSGGQYMWLLKNHPELLEEAFPALRQCWKNIEDVRVEAAKYSTKSEFTHGNVGAYQAALTAGIIDDLGFKPGISGFNTAKPAYLYATSLQLADGTDGVIFGVTNNHPNKRYKRWERDRMGRGVSFLFDLGVDALRIESMLKRELRSFAITEGQSPMQSKVGTSGEIVTGIPLDFILSAVHMCAARMCKVAEYPRITHNS